MQTYTHTHTYICIRPSIRPYIHTCILSTTCNPTIRFDAVDDLAVVVVQLHQARVVEERVLIPQAVRLFVLDRLVEHAQHVVVAATEHELLE